jgi:predicted transcriptional regulator
METEQLFTTAKWAILEQLSKRSMSPLEISNYVNTSLANISQSLRLLELAGIVTSKRVPNRDKGLPRIIYSLKADFALPITIGKNSAHKELMQIGRHRKATLNAWHYPNKKYQPVIEKLYEITNLHVEGIGSKLNVNILPKKTADKIKIPSLKVRGEKYTVNITSTESGTDSYPILFSKQTEVIPRN